MSEISWRGASTVTATGHRFVAVTVCVATLVFGCSSGGDAEVHEYDIVMKGETLILPATIGGLEVVQIGSDVNSAAFIGSDSVTDLNWSVNANPGPTQSLEDFEGFFNEGQYQVRCVEGVSYLIGRAQETLVGIAIPRETNSLFLTVTTFRIPTSEDEKLIEPALDLLRDRFVARYGKQSGCADTGTDPADYDFLWS